MWQCWATGAGTTRTVHGWYDWGRHNAICNILMSGEKCWALNLILITSLPDNLTVWSALILYGLICHVFRWGYFNNQLSRIFWGTYLYLHFYLSFLRGWPERAQTIWRNWGRLRSTWVRRRMRRMMRATTVQWKGRLRRKTLITVSVTRRKKRPRTTNKLDPRQKRTNWQFLQVMGLWPFIHVGNILALAQQLTIHLTECVLQMAIVLKCLFI